MKAIIRRDYGSPEVLKLEEVERPTPADDEVLVQVVAASLNAADWHLLRGKPVIARLTLGLFTPACKIIGADVAGRVEAIGRNVTQFRPGDEVFGDLAGSGFGGLAEYACTNERLLAPKPASLSFEAAAAVPMAAVTALQGLRDEGRLQAGMKVLIHGASGGVGTFAVQLARALGADVTAVCSTRGVELVRSLGAARVIDYTREDFATGPQGYDLIFAAGGDRSLFEYKRALSPTGRYVMAGGSTRQMFQALLLGRWASLGGSRHLGSVLCKPSQADLAFLTTLLEEGTVVPVIDRRFPLSEAAEAMRYLESGHPCGKIVITPVSLS
jgi:NADPH:quinone reductase-like Zn-dependent oxidoreductase